MQTCYDVIIVGAGSVGVPTALALGKQDLKTLVIDMRPSPGQGENKHAIGGIRATHSDPAKIIAGQRSLEIFSTWQQVHGDDIEWQKGGYAFPVYRNQEADLLKSHLPVQKSFNLNIDFVDAQSMQQILPGINSGGLMGGTFSPDDGSASPLLAINAFYRKACEAGVTFRFNEKVTKLNCSNAKINGVMTNKGNFYSAPVVIDVAGAGSNELTQAVGCDELVISEAHEAGITEPVAPFCPTMVVDLRSVAGSKNYYFYQNKHGQVVFCITPDPPVIGQLYDETSTFLPQICARMVNLMPRLQNIRVRRVWRGLYPMTADGSPLVGWNTQVEGLLHAIGMCGQGYMLGPGLGEILARMILKTNNKDDQIVLESFSLERDLSCRVEAFK
ncbi:MAG: FAD-binding oxidoreductase [Desulfobacteraceae bacterium]|nr:FAD-binding oxidoreductase [Desulfobacteraceae bacterium]